MAKGTEYIQITIKLTPEGMTQAIVGGNAAMWIGKL